MSIDSSTPKTIYTKLNSDGTKVNAGEWAWGNDDIVLMRMFDWGWLVIGATKADPNQFGLVRLRNGLDDDDPNAAVNQRVIKAALDGIQTDVSNIGDAVDGLEDEMDELNGRHFVKINNDDTVDAVAYNSVEHTRQYAH